MSSFSDWFRKLGHRLRKTQVPDKFLLPQLACNLENAEARLFKKLVQRGRLAPFYPGRDEPSPDEDVVECPICCMHYHIMNRTRCCAQRICSECIVQIRIGASYSNSCCPFCKRQGLDVEICEGKTESEKLEDELEKQRFEESRLRQIIETNSTQDRGNAPAEQENTSEEQQQPAPTTIPVTSGPPPQRYPRQVSLSLQGNSSSSSTRQPMLSHVELLHHHEHTPNSHRQTISNLSHNELVQCEEYLGVCPEDLGLRLEEFNDLLLEQTLISSMVEMRIAEKKQERLQLQRSEPYDQGASSSTGLDEDNEGSTGLRSHSLGQSVLQEEAISETRGGNPWSIETVLRHVSNSTPFSFLTQLASGETPGTTEECMTPACTESFQEGVTDGTVEPLETTPTSSDSSSTSAASGDVWRNLLNSLAGFDDVHTEFRMMTVRFDDPEIDAVFNRRTIPATDEPTSHSTSESTDRPSHEHQQEQLQQDRIENGQGPERTLYGEEMAMKEGETKTVMVEHPDGTMALTSIPCASVKADEVVEGDTEAVGIDPHDTAIVRAMQASDRSQLMAIQSADDRLRQLYSQSPRPT